ncbi:MAG TPA: protoporphyrinogen oxidase [Acidimicrobiales bacterium]|nr:protoporphyrinogen oxidase [Acidimicrobiales bacterium]
MGTATDGTGTTVAVVGGGIAGLSAAWELSHMVPHARIVVLESAGRLGGKLHTGQIGGRAVDLGPDAFLARRPEAVALCGELGLDDDLVSPGSRAAYVWARGRLRRLPAGLALGVPTRLGPLARSGILSPLGVGRAGLDVLGWRSPRGATTLDPSDRPVADITRRRLGREVTARLVDPLIGGIHAGDTTQMSAAAVFPALLDAAGRGGSLMRALRPASPPATAGGAGAEAPVFFTVRGGLSRLVDSLAAALGTRGVELLVQSPVDRLELRTPDDRHSMQGDRDATPWVLHHARGTVEADAVVLATPAGPTAALVASVDPVVAEMLRAIDYADVTLVTLQMPERAVSRPLDGTGFLVPASTGCLITACTWLTSKWPDLRRPDDILVRASMGRFGDDPAKDMSDDEIVRHVLADLALMMGLRSEPTEVVVTRWPEAFPQYAPGHLERLSSLEHAVALFPALALAGAAYGGVGIPACIASGRQAAHTVLERPVGAGLTYR